MTLISLTEKYNKLLDRYIKGCKFMDCFHLTGQALQQAVEEREKYLPAFIGLLNDINDTIKEIQGLGYPVTEIELLNGFSIPVNKAG